MSALWHAHQPIGPVLLPMATALLLLLMGDHRGEAARLKALHRQRALALASAVAQAALAWALLTRAGSGELMVYRVGDWPAPFGIVLVVDRLGALMLAVTAALALPVLWHASASAWDARGRHFHALFQFQLMGLNGAFITGDLFNLFVFFEVLLIASYVLMLHGGGGPRLRVGLQYVVLNLAASALFLVGLALVYGTTGTLNLADLALRVPQVSAANAAVLQSGALLLLVVFGFKAALAPVSLWLPATYAAACPPVAAFFAVMTKVGVYAIWRVHGVIFGADAGASAGVADALLLPLALATGAVGAVGALSAASLGRLASWLTVASVGSLLAALALGGAAAWGAALYYLLHSTLAIAALFLLAELVGLQRGAVADRIQPAVAVAQPMLLGALLLLAAVWAAGLPPLPGFIGKVALLQAAAGHQAAPAVWAMVLAVGFFSLLVMARAGIVLFWQGRPLEASAPPQPRANARLALPTVMLLGMGVWLSASAGAVLDYAHAAAVQLADTRSYARAVLGQPYAQGLDTRQPYRGERPAPPPTGAGAAPPQAATASGGSR